ncbi:MAG: FtsW/RodA/SpoVE family cell cycle protein [Prevotellaceae bacterium]|jgi:cell division protein FtsW|nr:FtsW/RodA/SpoVE family cell cycle protein [Prevotellaceae bacterium]
MSKLDNIDRYFKGDKMIWLVVMLLSVFSLLVVFSSTAALAARAEVAPFSYFLKQLMFLVVGFGVLYFISRLPSTLFMGAAQAGFWISIGLLLLMLIMGRSYNQAVRSLFGFQPAEIAKVALIIYVARLLTVNQDVIHEGWKKGYIKILLPVLATCGLIFLSNFSTAAVLGLTCFIMMFIGRVRIKHLVVTVGLAVALLAPALFLTKIIDDQVDAKRAKREQITGALATGYKIVSKTRLQTIYGRIFTWQEEKKEDTDKKTLQPTQSDFAKKAIASGGLLWGKGPGNSTMRYRLPEAFSDFVFAIVVEEYGVLFACIVILCYLIVLYRVGVMAKKSTRFFPTLLSIGISTQVMLQALVNMCVSTGITPVTGQNLPFISQGGSSLIITCVMFGILLSVSRSQTEAEEKEALRKAKLEAASNEQEQIVIKN